MGHRENHLEAEEHPRPPEALTGSPHGSRKAPTRLPSSSQTPGPPHGASVNVCYLSHPVCETSLGQPQETNASVFKVSPSVLSDHRRGQQPLPRPERSSHPRGTDLDRSAEPCGSTRSSRSEHTHSRMPPGTEHEPIKVESLGKSEAEAPRVPHETELNVKAALLETAQCSITPQRNEIPPEGRIPAIVRTLPCLGFISPP